MIPLCNSEEESSAESERDKPANGLTRRTHRDNVSAQVRRRLADALDEREQREGVDARQRLLACTGVA